MVAPCTDTSLMSFALIKVVSNVALIEMVRSSILCMIGVVVIAAAPTPPSLRG